MIAGDEYDWAAISRACGDGISFEEVGHVYTREGAELTPVTSIVNAAIPDVKRVRRFWTERHRRRGQVAHACTALDDLGRLDDASVAPAARGRVEAWRAFRRDYDRRFKVGLVEQRLWSAGGIGGTTDRVALWDGFLAIADLKGYVDPPYVRLQTAGYATLFHERTRLLPRVRLAIGLADDGTYDLHVWDDARVWVADRQVWAAAVRMYAFWRENRLLAEREDYE